MTRRADDDDGTIHIVSGVSAFTGKGFVQMRWGSEAGQLTPAQARVHACRPTQAPAGGGSLAWDDGPADRGGAR